MWNGRSARATSCECGVPKVSKNEKRIIGGNSVKYHRFPWAVAIFCSRYQKFLCGGALITHRHVITAAHCFLKLSVKPEEILVLLGINDVTKTEGATFRKAKSIARYSSVAPGTPRKSNGTETMGFTDDIVILEFEQPVAFSENILPVCLGQDGMDEPGVLTTIIGWGRISEKSAASNVLRHVEIPIQNGDRCAHTYQRRFRGESMICAGNDDGKKDACEGDSGGPMLVEMEGRWFMVGVVSFGFGCARAGKYGVYTRIPKYYEWITKSTKNEISCTGL